VASVPCPSSVPRKSSSPSLLGRLGLPPPRALFGNGWTVAPFGFLAPVGETARRRSCGSPALGDMARSPLITELVCGEVPTGATEDLRDVVAWAGALLESGYFMCSATVEDETLGGQKST
jgi:hypothetical protein